MIKHIVCFELLAEDADERAANIAVMKSELESLTASIPVLKSLEVGGDLGLVAGHWHAVLVAVVETNSDLEEYQAHPDHVRVSAHVGTFVKSRAIVDFVS